MFDAYDWQINHKAGSTLDPDPGLRARKPLKICFVADGRSPIARNWITYFVRLSHEVHVISSYPCPAGSLPGAIIKDAQAAFSRLSRAPQARDNESIAINGARSSTLEEFRSMVFAKLSLVAQHWLLPFDLQRHVQKVQGLIEQISPDIVHAMRIPFEGILAAKATPPRFPLLLSIWGNDLTLWASRNPVIAGQTRSALKRADGLHCDCQRDLNLATRDWGFDSNKPAAVLPGAGGVQAATFYSCNPNPSLRSELHIADDAPVVFNPRGFRGYVRNDVFFKSVPEVVRRCPNVVIVCAGMQSNPIADRWVRQLMIQQSVRLLPPVPRERMADLFRLASVSVSPSLHDGTPNTLLEAMACGCFPVAGDIDSIREWITDGYNGLLCDPTDPESLARAIVRALDDEQMRDAARKHNAQLIAERAEYTRVMQQAEEFYFRIMSNKQQAVRV